jgi:citrate lyase subunit beta/citryl-CoA lyase
MDSAARSIADVLLLDVEDSVQPKNNKQAARDNIIKYVEGGKFKKHYVFPRINDRDSGELLKDLMQLTIEGIHGFMYPKSTVGEDIYFIDKLLETIEFEKGFRVGTYKLIPLIETAGAVLNASDICSITKRVVAIAFGCEDFVTDIEGVHDDGGQSIFVARSMIAMAARANKVAPIDTVHIKVHDLVDLEKNLKIAKNLGFEGMLILNPKEIDLVHKYFTPSIEEISDAHEMIEVAIEYEKEGKGVAVKNGKFIGPPMVLAAKKIINKVNMINWR